MPNIATLKYRHKDKPAFCLGTAPHLNKLNLARMSDCVTIGCNQLVHRASELNLDYMVFQRESRLAEFRSVLAAEPSYGIVVPDRVFAARDWEFTSEQEKKLIPIRVRYTTPGHAEFFSFDLANCLYAGDSLAVEIQLAVWMGCNPIYVAGVDADERKPDYCDGSVADEQDCYLHRLDLRQWLTKVKTMLWARGIRLYDAAGTHSRLSVLPKIRLEAATGDPVVAVTSKTFSQDAYLVGELGRFFNHVRVNDLAEKLAGDNLAQFLSDADAVILGTEKLTEAVLAQLPCLRFVSKYGVGLDNVDFAATTRREVQVAYRKGVNSDSVAELTICHVLNLLRRVDESSNGYRQGAWRKLPGRELAEITLGIIGYGHVGKVVAKKFAALGVGRLLVHDLLDFPVATPAEFVPLDYLLAESDVVSLHLSMEASNRRMVDAAFISRMKRGAILINTARGELVDEASLAAALDSGALDGAALDVFDHEPTINAALAAIPNLLPSCHIAGSSNRAIKNMGWAAIEGLLELMNRSPMES